MMYSLYLQASDIKPEVQYGNKSGTKKKTKSDIIFLSAMLRTYFGNRKE